MGSMAAHKTTLILMTALCGSLVAVWSLLPHPALIAVICILPFAILFVLNQTFWFVSLFVLFSFFRIHEAFPVIYSLKIPLLLSLGALSALMWHTLISQKMNTYWHPSMTHLVIFWGLVTLGSILASNPGLSITYFKNIYWKIIIMTLAIAWLVDSEDAVKKIATLIIISGALISGVAIFNSLNGIGLVEGTRVTIGRDLGSVLGDPNDLSLVLMFPLAFAISFATTQQIGMARILGVVGVILAVWAVLATQSRGGLLGSLAVFGMFGLRLIRSKSLLITLGIIAATALFFMAGISDRQSGGAAEEGIDESAMGRLYAWEAAFKMALSNPLTGVGLNNFYANYFFYSSHWDGLNHAVHSTWFGVLAETGFLGLGAFIWLIRGLIKTSRETLSTLDSNRANYSPYLVATAMAVYAGIVGTIVSGTFLTQGFTWPIYILSALCIAISRITQNSSQNEKTR